MRILAFSTAFLPAFAHGGVPVAVFYLLDALRRKGHDIRVITSDMNWDKRLDVETGEWTDYKGLKVAYCHAVSRRYIYAPSMKRLVDSLEWDAEVVVSAGTVWNYPGILAMHYARRTRAVHLIYPHGLFDSWALKKGAIQKKLAWALHSKRMVQEADALVALNESEASAIRRRCGPLAVFTIPNGVRLDDGDGGVERKSLEGVIPELVGCRYVLFMSRISKQKGSDFLLSVWRGLRDRGIKLKLVMCGPTAVEFVREYQRKKIELGLDSEVLEVGTVSGHLKRALFSHAYCVVLPSLSEGMPMVVLESLAYGVPPFITPECNIPAVKEYDAGEILQRDVGIWINEITTFANDHDRRNVMSENAKRLSRKYSWDSVATETEEVMNRLMIRKASGHGTII